MALASVVRAVVLASVGLGMATTTARADDASEGRRLFQRGEAYLRQGDYRAAADAFEAGYRMAPRAGFLLNIGNCYRKLGELGKARQYYWRFLDSAPKDHPSRPGVMEYLRAMEQIEADGVPVDASGKAGPATPPEAAATASQVAPVTPPETAPAPPPAPEPSTAIPLASEPAAPAPLTPPVASAPLVPEPAPESGLDLSATLPPQPEPSHPIYRRWWFWTAIGAAVAAGVVATVIVARPSTATCAASLGCARE